MDWGAVIAGAMGGGANAVSSLADNYIEDDRRKKLLDAQAQVEIQKNEAIARFKQQMADEERRKMAGVFQAGRDAVQGQPTTVNDESGGHTGDLATPTEAQRNRGGVNALMQGGYYNEAKSADGVLDSGRKAVGYGQVMLDENNNVVYDNSVARQQADLQRAQARVNGTAAKGAPKPLTQADLDRIDQQVGSIVNDAYKSARNPFALPTDEKDAAYDTTKVQAVKDATRSLVTAAAQAGQVRSVSGVLHDLQPVVAQADQSVTARARELSKQFFDEKGLPLNGISPDAAQQVGLDPSQYTDANAFMRAYRDQNFNTALQNAIAAKVAQRRGAPQPGAPNTRSMANTANSNGDGMEPTQDASYKPPTEDDVKSSADDRVSAIEQELAQLRSNSPSKTKGDTVQDFDRHLRAVEDARRRLAEAQAEQKRMRPNNDRQSMDFSAVRRFY